MLVVDPERRYTVDQCLEHPWLSQKPPAVADSTDGLVNGIGGLEMHRRGVVRERTLLSSINSVHLSRKVPLGPNAKQPLKIYSKNPTVQPKPGQTQPRPDDERAPEEFVQMGGKGDQQLFANDDNSFYSVTEATAAKGGKSKGKGKGKVNGR
jgi:serine/threonine-protein kinase Chk2